MNVLAGQKPKCFFCQPTITFDQVYNQEFLRQSRFLEIRPFRETFQLFQQTKVLMGKKIFFFFSFLKRHLPIDLRNLEIFPDKQDPSFEFPETSRGFSLLPGSLHLLIYFKIFRSRSKKCSWSFQNIWLLFWMENEI